MSIDMDILEKIRDILDVEFGIPREDVEYETNLDDLDIDLLEQVSFIMSVETNFKILIPDGIAENMLTIKSIVDYIKEHKA